MDSISASEPGCAWKPLNSVERRVLGVLVEKAKTTPDVYPLTLNSLCSGCNQKNNRDPVMQLEPEQVEQALDHLRQLKAVMLVQGSGRVEKYRHALYDWLGVDKIELSVMAELLLRGEQTEGELRGRVSRMDPIADLEGLRVILESLRSKGLIMYLSPAGRGRLVTHTLYSDREKEHLRTSMESSLMGINSGTSGEHEGEGEGSREQKGFPRVSTGEELEQLKIEFQRMMQEHSDLKRMINQLTEQVAVVNQNLDQLKKSLGA